jgi:hypothetical protein
VYPPEPPDAEAENETVKGAPPEVGFAEAVTLKGGGFTVICTMPEVAIAPVEVSFTSTYAS